MSLVKAWSDPGIAEIEPVPIAADRKCKNPRCSSQRQLAIADRLYRQIRDAQGGVSRLMVQ